MKWQEYLVALDYYRRGLKKSENLFKNLIAKYGETREFTNGMGEYLFHHNPSQGNRFSALFGKEKLHYSDQAEKTIRPGRYPFAVLPATLMANSDYRPMSEYYDILYMRLQEEQGELEKAIAFWENIPVVHTFSLSKGYATYRLSRLYEKSGQIDKALAKCNLLIKDYAQCDEKYKPWVEEVTQRRDRLMAKML